MNKLFLTLLLTVITVTSIKPAEQVQPNSSWLRTACIAGAGVVGLGAYAWATGAREKKKRLRGHIVGHIQPGVLPAVPGTGRWDYLLLMTAGLLYIDIWSLFGLGANNLIGHVFGTRSFAPASIANNSKFLGLSLIPLLLISELIAKRSSKFKLECIQANPNTYEEQCRLNSVLSRLEESLIDNARKKYKSRI